MIKSRTVRGDTFEHASDDVIVQFDTLRVGMPVPEGWRVLSGNMHNSEIVRVVLRYELEDL